MRVLLLEFASCSGSRHSLLPEGFALLRLMAQQFEEAGFLPVSLLHPDLRWLREFLPGRVEEGSFPPSLSPRPDASLIIAPPRELVELTNWLEKKGVKMLGANGDCARLAGDKWITYLRLRGKVNLPTARLFPPPSGKWVVKPRWGAGGEGVRLGLRAGEGEFFQRFVRGIHASCCLIAGKGVSVLSFNRQVLSFSRGRVCYRGSDVPLELPPSLSKKCEETASLGAGLLGAKGLCGVDLVVGREPYFIELNPRPTTSFLALSKILKGNLAELLVEGEGKPEGEGKACVRILDAPPTSHQKAGRMVEVEGLLTPPVNSGEGFRMVVVGWGKTWKEALRKVKETGEEVHGLAGA